ncbi:hypothetical protein SDC9_81148 [bioreactor metagenome]|uniref:Uncharacterized protein n=1 Tax=bioreactor metagenome TaxID=1076179 RepID=A0A644Z1F3_9ZZZZ
MVCCRRTGSYHHIQCSGADGAGYRHDFSSVVLLGKRRCCVDRSLFILCLIEGQSILLISQSFPDAYHTAVAEDAEDTLDKFGFLSVEPDVLVVQKAQQGLRHSQSYRCHASLLRARALSSSLLW